jgi:hypothetical protein
MATSSKVSWCLLILESNEESASVDIEKTRAIKTADCF